MKIRTVLQFSAGPKKGMFAQVISEDGKCLTRDMSGSQYVFDVTAEDKAIIIGVAALGPKVETTVTMTPVSAVPPPLNPEELLSPLPPEVKAKPMNAEPKKKKVKKPKPEPYTGPKLPYVFKIRNTLGDECEVTVHVRADKKPTQYKGAAIMMAAKVIPPTDLMTAVEWRLKE